MASSKNSEYVCNHVKKRKKDLASLFGGKCCICGFDAFQEALEFHHIDPSIKSFGLTDSTAVTKALEKQLEEARKCVLLCANCHRGVHAGYLELPKGAEYFFNEKRAQELIEEKQRKIYRCERCGVEITHKANLCAECASLASRKVDRPSREELKALIREKPFTHIAKDYSVTDNAIRRWCDSYGLPSKKKEINVFSNEEWEKV